MNIFRFAVALIAALSAPAVLAQLDDHNENASMSIVGAETIRVAPGGTVPERFSVRIVDAQGVPMEGLAVWFFPDGCGESGGPDFFYCPPWAVYGTFDPPVNVPIHTDANGVATAPPFTAGSIVGTYNVAAGAWYPLNAENARLGNGEGIATYFHIQQVEPSTTVPITSGFTGAWYDPNQSGHGLLIEVLPENRLLAYWFAFTPDGTQQAWFGGDGPILGDVATIYSYQGQGGRWIPNFDPAVYVLQPWGQLTFTFTDCDHGRVDFAGNGNNSPWGTNHMDITRLTHPAGLSCP